MRLRTIGLTAALVLAGSNGWAAESTSRPAMVRVACVGDSVTEGFTIKHPEKDGYPADLNRMLGDRYVVKNYGAGGCTLLHNGDRPYTDDGRHYYQKATDFDPNVVVIMLGTNDSKPQNMAHADDFSADLAAMVDHFQQLPAHPAVYLCLPPPAFADTWGITDANVSRLIPSIRRVAADRHATLIDVHAALAGDQQSFSDGIHPNAAGAVKIAETVAAAIRQHAPDAASTRRSEGGH